MPANLAEVEHAIDVIHRLTGGETIKLGDVDVVLDWARSRVPVYMAGYGPRALTLAGRVGDGVVFQVADPYFIEWGMQWVRKGAEEAGRDPAEIVVHCSSATFIWSGVGLLVAEGHEADLYEGNGDAALLERFVGRDDRRGISPGVAPDEVLRAARELLGLGVRQVVVSVPRDWADAEQDVGRVVRARYPEHYLRSVPLQLASDVTACRGRPELRPARVPGDLGSRRRAGRPHARPGPSAANRRLVPPGCAGTPASAPHTSRR